VPKTLVRTASFELCPSCRRHGRIKTADGQAWLAVGSQEEAYIWLVFIQDNQRPGDPHFITVEEAGRLKDQIQCSGLPKQFNEVPTEVREIIQELNCRDENSRCLLPAHLTADLP